MIENRKDLESYLAADLHAYGLDRWRLRHRILQRPAHFQRLLRKSEYWTNSARTPAGRLLAGYLRLRTKFLGERLGFDIPRNVFGPGLSIAHIGSIVVNCNAKVSSNCRIHHGVTIGEGRAGEYPTIGDDVFISVGARCSAPMSAAVWSSTRARSSSSRYLTMSRSPAIPPESSGTVVRAACAPRGRAPRSGTQIADRHRKLVQHNVSKPTVSLIADRGLRVAGHIECCNGVKAGIVAAVPSQQHGRIVHQVRTIRFVLLPIDRSP